MIGFGGSRFGVVIVGGERQNHRSHQERARGKDIGGLVYTRSKDGGSDHSRFMLLISYTTVVGNGHLFDRPQFLFILVLLLVMFYFFGILIPAILFFNFSWFGSKVCCYFNFHVWFCFVIFVCILVFLLTFSADVIVVVAPDIFFSLTLSPQTLVQIIHVKQYTYRDLEVILSRVLPLLQTLEGADTRVSRGSCLWPARKLNELIFSPKNLFSVAELRKIRAKVKTLYFFPFISLTEINSFIFLNDAV